jgi:hypothetical protein
LSRQQFGKFRENISRRINMFYVLLIASVFGVSIIGALVIAAFITFVQFLSGKLFNQTQMPQDPNDEAILLGAVVEARETI